MDVATTGIRTGTTARLSRARTRRAGGRFTGFSEAVAGRDSELPQAELVDALRASDLDRSSGTGAGARLRAASLPSPGRAGSNREGFETSLASPAGVTSTAVNGYA